MEALQKTIFVYEVMIIQMNKKKCFNSQENEWFQLSQFRRNDPGDIVIVQIQAN